MNVPIGLLAIFLSFRLLPESKVSATKRHFDIPGAISVTAGLSILVYALVDADSAGWGSTQTILLLIVSAALLSAFVGVERRAPSPLVPGRLVQLATVRGSNIVALLVGASLFSMFFFVSLYMQQVLGFSPLETGLAYLPLAVTIIISAGLASQLVTKMGFKPILMVGLAFIAVGLAWFAQVSTDGSYLSRRARPVAARGGRPRLLVRAGHDRRRLRDLERRRRDRLRPDQRLPADRRRARPRRAGDDRQRPHRRRDGRRRAAIRRHCRRR